MIRANMPNGSLRNDLAQFSGAREIQSCLARQQVEKHGWNGQWLAGDMGDGRSQGFTIPPPLS
jgi:hypothetical protein